MRQTSTDLYHGPWKVFGVLDVDQRKPTVLGASSKLLGTDQIPMPPGVNFLTTDGVHAWWTITYPTDTERGFGVRIMVRDIAGREPLRTAVDKAKLPVAIGGGIAYVRSFDVDPSAPKDRYEIRLRNDGQDTLVTSGRLAKGQRVSTMCASDDFLAWAVTSPGYTEAGRVHLLRLATKERHTIQLEDAANSLDLGCGDSFVAWGNGSSSGDPGQYVFDLPTGKIWKLGAVRGISVVYAAGPMLGWTLPPTGRETAPVRVTKWQGA